jgi:hypothetical protein
MPPIRQLLSNADEAGDAVRQVIRAYHGSPNPEHIDRFDPKFLGTGQGAHSYSFGHYSAQNPAVADDYRRSLSYKKIKDDFLRAVPEDGGAEEVMDVLPQFDPRQQQFLRAMDSNDWLGFDYPSQAVSQAMKRDGLVGYDATEELASARSNLGTGYELEIAHPETNLMDWDGFAHKGQPSGVSSLLEAVRGISANPASYKNYRGHYPSQDVAMKWNDHQLKNNMPTGADLWRAMATMDTPEVAAKKFLEAGVPGVRYLDSGSRGTAGGTRNYVMFPGTEDQIRILRKY